MQISISMKAQTALEKEIAKYIGIFVEGMIEVLFAAIISLMAITIVNALNYLPSGSSSSPNIILEYVALVVIASIIINFVKGMVVSGEAIVSVAGLIAGLWLFGSIVTSIAPNAIIEVISYIIASIAGIVLGAYIRSNNQQGGMW